MTESGVAHKNVVITGCSSGFGHVTAFHLARRGWRVLATLRSERDLARLAEEAAAESLHDRIIPMLCDITRAEDVASLRERAEAFGLLHGLVNNAGTGFPGPLELLALDDLRAQFEVNVLGHLAVTQALLPLLKAGRGVIINVSSVSGGITYPINGAYSMSKFALEAMSDALRLELAPSGVKVAVVQAGSSPTGIWHTSLNRAQENLSGPALAHYQPLIESVRKHAMAQLARGFPPALFARTVERILTHPRPAARYPIPAYIGLLIAVRRLLPDRLWDWGVRRVLRW